VELKEKILRLLREDEEFRLAVAGLIGLDAILSELKKLREDFHYFMKEQERRWEENNKRWEENNRRWEENWRRWEENNKRWEEAYRRFEVIEKTLLEHSILLRNLEKRVSRLELEVGALSEITLTRYVWEDLREELRLRGEEVVVRARNARVDGYEVDLLVETNKNVYIVEVKVEPTRKHVDSLLKKAKVVQERYGKPVISILAGAMIGNDVEKYAESKNIKIYKY
jgi:Holliday junction resolvase-like predicted endonuclease